MAPDTSHRSGTSANPMYGSGGDTTPTLSAPLTSLIGGQETAIITAPAGKQLSTVTWQISGAEQSQSYTNAVGTTTDLPNPTVSNASGQSFQLTFYWNATDGNHTVAATAIYTDGSSGSAAPLTVNVLKPTVSSYTIGYTQTTWGAVPGNTDGFSFDMTYNATVALPNNANTTANFGFIQLVNWNETENNAISGQHTFNTGGFVLDNVPAQPNPGDPGYLLLNWTSPLMTGTTPVSTPIAPNQLIDSPHASYSQKGGDTNDAMLDLNVTAQFTTTLAYRPNPGIWVGLSTTPTLVMAGHETWDSINKFVTVSASPQQGGTLNGAANQAFVTWTGYFTAIKMNPPY